MSSLYVHIPFCQHICSYCDFSKVYYNERWADDYLKALQYEINDKNINQSFDTIYIGGGTPSSLSYEQLQLLLEILKPFSKNTKEYSIEINPETMSNEKLDLMIQYGINRLSIGVQTFHDNLLEHIERYHTSQQAIDWIKRASLKGIDDINVDLIYGLPYQTLKDVDEDIAIIHSLNVSHVSIYSLILEDHTLLRYQNYQPLNDEEDALWYDHINNSLKKIGFLHYEVSNYYQKKPSLHNLAYWHYQDYEGIGLGAHSLQNHCRYENTKSLTRYLDGHYLNHKEFLNHDGELFECLMMGLRLTEGIDLDAFNKRYQVDLLNRYSYVIDKYQRYKMLEVENGFLKTTALGMKYLNTLLVDFLD